MKAKRRQFLIDRGFQLKFTFMTVSFIAALSVIYPLVIDVILDLSVATMRQLSPGADLTSFESQRKVFLGFTFLIQVAFVLGCAAVNFFISHRIAGPILKMRRAFEMGFAADAPAKITFRKHDYFPELAEGFNQFREKELQFRKNLAMALQNPDPRAAVQEAQALLNPPKQA